MQHNHSVRLLARGELAPQLSLVSPKVFSPFSVTWWSLGSLPLMSLACLAGDTQCSTILLIWLHWHYWMRTELNRALSLTNDDRTASLNHFPVFTVKMLRNNLYCIKCYINKGDWTWLAKLNYWKATALQSLVSTLHFFKQAWRTWWTGSGVFSYGWS